jgi:hypothetical protein
MQFENIHEHKTYVYHKILLNLDDGMTRKL